MKMKVTWHVCLVLVAIFFSLYYREWTVSWLWWISSFLPKLILYVLAALASAAFAVYQHKPEWSNMPKITLQPVEHLLQKTKEKLLEYKYIPKKSVKHKALISRNVDDVIDELIALLLRDYISSWYNQIVQKQSMFCNNLKPLIREMLFTFRDRCHAINDIKFFTSDIVTIVHKHLQKVKSSAVQPPDVIVPYKVYPFLEQKELELDYLRQMTEFFLITLLPKPYAKCKPLRNLLREVFACSVFYPVIEKTCDPDFINLKLISWLKSHQEAVEKHKRLYSAAETYEDFVKLVRDCNSIEGLQQWRYYIVAETMAANTMKDFKCSKGVEADKEFNTEKRNKGDLLQSRNLPQYLNQLHFSKRLCEKKLKLLGGPDYISSSPSAKSSLNQSLEDKIPISCRTVLSMEMLMQSSYCRKHFSRYLQKEEMHSLLGFWEAVEEMKTAEKSSLHQLANDIVQMYVHNQASAVRLGKNTLKGIEDFMMANKGPEAFAQAQEEIYKQLDENFYASFIVSDTYHKMVAEATKQGVDFTRPAKEDSEDEELSGSQKLDVKADNDVTLFDHSGYARTQLKLTQEKLNDKLRALHALKSNPKCDKKVTTMLDKEIQELCMEQSTLQNHIEKTELWIKYLGLWQTTLVQAELMKENDKIIPYFNIMVHLSNEAHHPDSESVGWIVTRNLQSFHSLHQKLVPAATWLKKIDLPTKPRFKSPDRTFLERTKASFQTFLSAVTKDDGLNKSEALYAFLSPSPEHMKHPPPPPKKSIKFNILQLFKGVQMGFGQSDEGQDEALLFLDDIVNKSDGKDSIAEPSYGLISEIFELKGPFNWVRRSLMTFVQLAYGKTINKQIRESVSYIVSEPMLLYYLQLFRDTMWPASPSSPNPLKVRTETEKLQTKFLAKQVLLDNIPEVIVKLVSQQVAEKGMIKIFNALQNEVLNKQLFYVRKIFLFVAA